MMLIERVSVSPNRTWVVEKAAALVLWLWVQAITARDPSYVVRTVGRMI